MLELNNTNIVNIVVVGCKDSEQQQMMPDPSLSWAQSVAGVGSEPEKLRPLSLCALITNDGRYLRYDYAKSRAMVGSHKATYSFKTDTFDRALESGCKVKLPRLDLSAGTLGGVFADFDDIEKLTNLVPVPFCESWDGIRKWLASEFPNGCVFPSASGKAKVFFPFSRSTQKMSDPKMAAMALVGKSLYQAIDYNGGLRYSFINSMSYEIVSSWLKSCDCLNAVINNDDIISIYLKRGEEEKNRVIVDTCSTHPTNSEYTWKPYVGELPKNMVQEFKTKTKNRHVEGVIRFALGTNTCVGKLGVAIPQTLLGKMLGIPQRTAGRAIKCAIELGILRKTIPAIEGKRAAKYLLCGFWAVWARQMFKAAPAGSQVGLKVILDSICDGNWNDPLFKMTNFFASEVEYLAFVSGLPGFHDKVERKSQAVSAWKSHAERDASREGRALKEA